MSEIWVTGDIHGNPQKRLSKVSFPEGQRLTKDDYVIICGDFGCVWDFKEETKEEKYNLDWLESLPFSVLFCDGNHECFPRLNSYPEKEWKDGRVHEIRPHVLHLMRGYVFNIDGKKIFAFGGAKSHDIQDGILDPRNEHDMVKIKCWRYDMSKSFRILNVSWWADELPSEEEMARGLESLEKNDYTVDFVITHSPSTVMLALLGHNAYNPDILSDYLDKIRNHITYKYWFCGHIHINKVMDAKDIILFEQIVRIH